MAKKTSPSPAKKAETKKPKDESKPAVKKISKARAFSLKVKARKVAAANRD